jgi:hypothetical protein
VVLVTWPLPEKAAGAAGECVREEWDSVAGPAEASEEALAPPLVEGLAEGLEEAPEAASGEEEVEVAGERAAGVAIAPK